MPIRLLISGAILLMLSLLGREKQILRIFREDCRDILIFGVLGMSMCQYTYFTAVGASNAGTATVLQYTGPVMILLWICLKNRRLPRVLEMLAIAFALTGTFLLATHGRPGSMVLSGRGLRWGLLAAVALAFYTVQPEQLLKKHGSLLVTGWAMFIGGVVLMLVFRPWTMRVMFDFKAFLAMCGVVLLGTVMSFTLFLEGVRCIGPQKSSLYSSVEPVSATLFSSMLMGSVFGAMDLLGFACIISTIFLLAIDKQD